jgi:hypothetical protein
MILDGIGGYLKDDAQKRLVDVLSGEHYARQFHKNPQRVWQAPVIITCDSTDLSGIARITRVCELVEFSTPNPDELRSFFRNVCEKEQLNLPENFQEQVVRGCGGDVRRLLNTVHFVSLPKNLNNSDDISVADIIDVDTMFYNHHSMFDIAVLFLKRIQCHEPLQNLITLMELHPISLAMLIQENSVRMYRDDDLTTLENMAETADFISSINSMDEAVHGPRHQWELEEVFTTLSTWGVAQTIKPTFSSIGESATANQFEKSAYYGWHQKLKYRRKLMANFSKLPGMPRGESFIDQATVISAMILRHSKHASQKKECNEELLAFCKEQHLTYKDLQDLWKCAHGEHDTKMPNPRGNLSLRKLI